MTSDKGGRPPIGGRVTFRLAEGTRARIEAIAARQGVKLADVIRELIDEALEQRGKP